ncbi:MAG: hypothetical protein A3E01_03700 [Gammaproteobacteria bacterium RIFCSPHIGHO2_12_FULL_63_22]|nr:MAG: hypothetical protein A3E01_03700 [Gammaproteobacteria bacterium RIFCSPHIGHO2_12_FULL_63_22]
MSPRLLTLIFLLVAFSNVAPASGKKPDANGKPIWLEPAQLTLTVSKDGSPRDVACVPTVAPMICKLILPVVSTWNFTPGLRAGLATEMELSMELDLVAVPKPGGFGVQAIRAWTHVRSGLVGSAIDPETRRVNPPRYPADHLRKGRTGMVVMELWPQPDSDYARVGQVWFDGKPSSRKNDFVTATLDAAAKWKTNRGSAEQLSFCVPVEYTIEGRPRAGMDDTPCVATYVEGFAPPKLLTDVANVSF